MTFLLKRVLAAATLSLVLSACSGLKILDLTVPRDARVVRDIADGDNPREMLDVFIPKDAAPAVKRSVVLFFYGGSWTSGSRGEYRFAGEALAKLGFIAVVADYRLYPEVKFPV